MGSELTNRLPTVNPAVSRPEAAKSMDCAEFCCYFVFNNKLVPHTVGFGQFFATIFEPVRLVMVQRLLSSAEFKMDPLVSLYYSYPHARS
ncbi:hypothetical protein MPDQ_006324 [Monascus purpureus]|uniref:Uncharacterized protein n=1 Tax=Monascus purpureus TaxID=5098 RepID=A0A507QYT3_MONPU|nr:hypothetical protein MPDQ_006324 [Monascus purpureus]